LISATSAVISSRICSRISVPLISFAAIFNLLS
jgi:hypothetical protein